MIDKELFMGESAKVPREILSDDIRPNGQCWGDGEGEDRTRVR